MCKNFKENKIDNIFFIDEDLISVFMEDWLDYDSEDVSFLFEMVFEDLGLEDDGGLGIIVVDSILN